MARRKGRRRRWSRRSTGISLISPRSSSATWASRSTTYPAQAPPAGSEEGWSHLPAASCRRVSSWSSRQSISNRASKHADLCLTGEGAIDGQSAFGKTAVGVARLARALSCPVLALAGSIGPGASAVLDQGIDAYFSICPGPIELEQAISQAAELLERATEQAVRGFLAGRSPQDVIID